MTELESQAEPKPTTLPFVLAGRHLLAELPTEIGGVEGAIDTWGKINDKTIVFGDWLLAQTGVVIVSNAAQKSA